MITQEQVKGLLKNYDMSKITIGCLGGHSALDVCAGAKKLGFSTIAVCQKGREKTYDKYFRTRNGKGIVDDTIIVDKFSDITKKDVQEQLRKRNTVFVHNRYFWVYCAFEEIEKEFMVPIFGTRNMVRLEERHMENNQYDILRKAGIRI